MPFALRTSLADIESFFHRVDGAGRKKSRPNVFTHEGIAGTVWK